MFKYKRLIEEYSDEECNNNKNINIKSKKMSMSEKIDNNNNNTSSFSTSNKKNSNEDKSVDFHTQFGEEDFKRDIHEKPMVTGPSGIFLPRLNELPQLVDSTGAITVMCFTWNIASRATCGLYRLNAVFAKIPQADRPDLIAVALQELPTSTFKFHHNMVEVVGESLNTTHRVFCWVRKWSQMLIIFIRKRLSLYTSHPEYKFVSSNNVARPFRTKGAIGICFRLLQTSCIFIGCHLTHGLLKNRVMDYHKFCQNFDFKSLKLPKIHHTRSTQQSNGTTKTPTNNHINNINIINGLHQIPMKKANNIFWFGDLNFRVLANPTTIAVEERIQNKLFKSLTDFDEFLANDELKLERDKGLIFHEFKEGIIKFPPTHKYIIGSNKYAENRIPSYTDRVLYWSKNEDALIPLRYDSIDEIDVSDHKPVYCIFRMQVLNKSFQDKNFEENTKILPINNGA